MKQKLVENERHCLSEELLFEDDMKRCNVNVVYL